VLSNCTGKGVSYSGIGMRCKWNSHVNGTNTLHSSMLLCNFFRIKYQSFYSDNLKSPIQNAELHSRTYEFICLSKVLEKPVSTESGLSSSLQLIREMRRWLCTAYCKTLGTRLGEVIRPVAMKFPECFFIASVPVYLQLSERWTSQPHLVFQDILTSALRNGWNLNPTKRSYWRDP
jgi:hypothetical protein